MNHVRKSVNDQKTIKNNELYNAVTLHNRLQATYKPQRYVTWFVGKKNIIKLANSV